MTTDGLIDFKEEVMKISIVFEPQDEREAGC